MDRLLAAGESLLEEHAFEQAGVVEIVRRADSSVGTFYRLVGDKDRLLRAIHDRFTREAHTRIERELAMERFAERDAAEVVRGFVQFLVEVRVSREGLLRALIIRSSAEPEFRSRVHALNDALEERLVALLRPHRAAIAHPRPWQAVRFGVKVVLGALNQHTLVHSPEARAPRELAGELSRVLGAYLGID